ncbi:hypothetical protein F52700_2547 [Fusarium sp. NRRL 52700]|nr:hypothetical protein F52700_2547 [Fusarium sp. NRRL 52700]
MAAPRRSKRIQALNQSDQGSLRVDGSPESSKKYHRERKRKMAGSQGGMSEGPSKEQAHEERAPEEQAPKKQVPGISPERIEQEKREADEHERQRTRSRAYVFDRHLNLNRLDEIVGKKWKSLVGSISALVDVTSIHNATWDCLDEALQRKFNSYAPNAEELFEPYGMNRLMFQRWVWEIIDENFFSDKSKDIVWTSPYWEAQATMERYLRDHHFPYYNEVQSRKFPHWRYTTMDLYMSLKDSPQSRRRIDPTCVVPIIAKALGRYFPEEYDERDPANGPYPALRTLANAVVDFEFLFDANLTFFSHIFHHPNTQQTCGFPFQHDLNGIEGQAMTDHYGGLSSNEEGQNVDLVVNPMLLQRGSRDGYGYNVKRAVYPMEVCVAWLEAHRKLQDSPEDDGREQQGEETGNATVEEKSEEHDEDDSEDEDKKEQGKEGEALAKEEEEEEEEDEDQGDEGITEEGGKNNKTKKRVNEEVNVPEEEGVLTKQEEKKINTKDTTNSKKNKKNKNKGKRH